MNKSSYIASAVAGAAILGLTAGTAFSAADNGRYIVQFKDGQGVNGRSLLTSANVNIKLDLDHINAVAVEIPADAAERLRKSPYVAWVEEDVKRYAFSAQFEPNNTYGIEMVQADLIPEVTLAPSKTVCIIDSGLDMAHPEFASQTNISGTNDAGTGNWFTDENGHGTHVAGTVAALANGEGVVGVNPGGALNLHIIKVFDANGWAYSSNLIGALKACGDAGADIISMSLGGPLPSDSERNAFKIAFQRGAWPIAAAGNGDFGIFRNSYPASYPHVTSVGAVDANKAIADFSQQNDQVEVVAPGVSVLSSVPVGTGSETIAEVDGTGYEAFALDGSPYATVNGPLVDCGLAETPCAATGAVCLIQRGNISFSDKVLNCQAGGGTAAIIYNNEPGNFFGTLGGVATSIPSVSVSGTDGLAMQGGTNALVSVNVGDYDYFNGTSMATPHVSGVAALLWNNFPHCSGLDVRRAMAYTAEDLGAAGKDITFGYGLIQAQAAYNQLMVPGFCGSP